MRICTTLLQFQPFACSLFSISSVLILISMDFISNRVQMFAASEFTLHLAVMIAYAYQLIRCSYFNSPILEIFITSVCLVFRTSSGQFNGKVDTMSSINTIACFIHNTMLFLSITFINSHYNLRTAAELSKLIGKANELSDSFKYFTSQEVLIMQLKESAEMKLIDFVNKLLPAFLGSVVFFAALGFQLIPV